MYNIILCDWVLPDGEGTSIVGWIRKRKSFDKTPFIMISCKDSTEDIIRAFMIYDVDAYIPKPFTKDQLLRIVKQAYEARIKNTF